MVEIGPCEIRFEKIFKVKDLEARKDVEIRSFIALINKALNENGND